MKPKRSIIYFLLIIITAFITAIFLPGRLTQTAAKQPLQPLAQATPVVYQQIEQAILEAIKLQQKDVPLLLLYETRIDHITLSEDGDWATAWMTPLDPENGNPIPVEPGITIVRRGIEGWSVILPSDSGWVSAAWSAPAEILPVEMRAIPLADIATSTLASTNAPYGGYFLPWAGGETMALTQSVAHDRYTPSGNAHYAFDFAKPGYPSGMFDVHAAKSGTVKQAVWQYENGNESFGNYLVLEDTSTSPATYQLYLHFAKDSIPQELRVVGAPVLQGQFIGIADDTGISSGNHLHFMVHTNPASYWGTSVDITFNDVSINGGRPRITADLPYCEDTDICEETQYYYVSGNIMSGDTTPPIGGILSPNHGAIVHSNPLRLEGWGSDDDSGLAKAQFLAAYHGVWSPVGSEFNSEQFGMNWDICEASLPDGPISLALELWDNVSNKTTNLHGLIHFTKNLECTSELLTCTPGINQVALFADRDYKGECIVLGIGSYTATEDLSDNADAILVGASVQATLFMNSSLDGRAETFTYNDSNLDDNRIGANSVSSLLVQLRSTAPAPPRPVWPADNAIFTQDESFSLVWEEAGAGIQYQARLQGDSGDPIITTWQTAIAWHLNMLQPGSYTWQVKARNSFGESEWSSGRALEIQSSTAGSTSSISAPFEDSMETTPSGWTNSNYWALSTDQNHTPGGVTSWKYETNSSNGYDTGLPNSGHLTSPAIDIPVAGEYYLQFWYHYETESLGLHWDQRWVQISANGGEYINIHQLSNDPANHWLQSPLIPLSAYAGQTIRVRFYFATLDSVFNNFIGWFIDDFSIHANAPPNCGDDDNNFIQAQEIAYNTITNGLICPGGDLDFYKFQAIAGDRMGAYITAQDIGSTLDSYLYLIDSDGHSILAENDDILQGQRTDSWITYQFDRTGTYYLMVRSWYHPTAGDLDQTYILSLVEDSQDPVAQFVYPQDSGSIPNKPIVLKVAASDSGSGVSYVQFFWHSSDWQNSDWMILGEDWNPQDGWSYNFDASGLNPTDIAFYARIYDWAGNWIGAGAWFIGLPKIYFPMIIK
ncbi:peptidoglycan DD-metalloendopeptidase family protein [Chloroflexota bacterium]